MRRGNLKLPCHFPPEVKALSGLGLAQLRSISYHSSVDCGTNTFHSVSTELGRYIQQVQPGGCIRTVTESFSHHVWHSKNVKRLSKSDWPRLGTRAAWPSSPSLLESMEMARRGLTPSPFVKPEPVDDRIGLAEFNSNVDLRARLISQQVVGIRADKKVPKSFLGHFRYRYGFLILTAAYNLPAGLVRYLTGQWISDPHSLWLRRKCYFKSYLKSTTPFRRSIGPW